jgi:hypothetical protein
LPNDEQNGNGHRGDIKPIPDPSRLTTEQLYREIAALRDVVETRLTAMDLAVTLAREDYNRQPTAIERAISHLRDQLGARLDGMDKIRDLRFAAVVDQFKERDHRVEAALSGTQELAAQHNATSAIAITKSEGNTIKQLDQIMVQIATQDKAHAGLFADIKERLYRIEGKELGKTDTEKSHRDNTSLYIALAVAIVSFLSLAIGAVGLFIALYHKA